MDTWDDATAQAEAVRAGQISPLELVDAAIARIEKLNPSLNAVIHPRFEQARQEAAATLPDGPFRGVPLLLKDLHCAQAGEPHHCGMSALKAARWVEDHDSAVVRRFRQAGFVIVGRTNVPEMGTTITTEPAAYGPSRNPWDTAHSTGGSSGGSAAAVAAGMVAVAHGSDGGGSIRIPASECGLVGLKPARARISRAPDAGEGWMGASTDGALTRSVRDAAAVLDILSGPEPGDPYAAVPLGGPLAGELGAVPCSGPGDPPLRFGLLSRPLLPGVAADPEAEASVAAAGRRLEELGYRVEVAHPAALEEAKFADCFLRVVAVHTAAEVAAWSQRLGRPIDDGELEPLNQLFAGLGRTVSGPGYVEIVNWLHGWTRRVAAWWADDGWDVLVTPVLNGPPPPLGWLTDPEQGGDRVSNMLQYTSQWNVTGQPAVSLPLGTSSSGLPMGVQLVAGAGREDVLVRVASRLEAAAPWPHPHPPLC
jgi:amidase